MGEEEEARRRPHAVLVPLPLQGHINPMLHLAQLLASHHGFSITFVNTEFNSTSTPALIPPQPHIRFLSIPDGLPPDHGRSSTNPYDLFESVFAHFPSALLSLLHSLPPVTCLVSNSFLYFAQDIADQLRLPYVAFWTQSAASYASVKLVADGYRPPEGSDPSDLITCVPGVPPFKISEMNTFLQCYDPENWMFDFFVRPFKRIGESEWILANSFDELEQETVAALQKEHPIYTVGPLLPSSFFDDSFHSQGVTNASHNECLSWLDKHPPHSVLYVSFGSLALISAEELREIALGLEASGQRFLWVLRAGVMWGQAAELPEGFLERVGERASIVSWAPQLQVLSHEAVGGFMTHCGWNSTLEGISAGVALVGWSFVSDQPMNCRCAEEMWGVGMKLERVEGGVARKEEVEKKVRELMQGERGKEVKTRARRWRESAQRAVAGSSFNNLELFANAMRSRARLTTTQS